MTIFEMLTTTLSAVALLGVVKNLRGLQQQVDLMKQQTETLDTTLRMSAETALDNLFIPVTQAYLDYPDLRAILSPEEDDPPPRDREMTLRASALAETLCDAMERALMFRRDGLHEPAENLRNWIEDSFRRSKFLRSWLLNRESWYGAELVEIAQNAAT